MSAQLTPAVLDRWRAMANFRGKHTLQQIADMFGVSLWTVHKCVTKYATHLLNTGQTQVVREVPPFTSTPRRAITDDSFHDHRDQLILRSRDWLASRAHGECLSDVNAACQVWLLKHCPGYRDLSASSH